MHYCYWHLLDFSLSEENSPCMWCKEQSRWEEHHGGGGHEGQDLRSTASLPTVQLCSQVAALNSKPLTCPRSRHCSAGKGWRLSAWVGPSADEAHDDIQMRRLLCSTSWAAGQDAQDWPSISRLSRKASSCRFFLKPKASSSSSLKLLEINCSSCIVKSYLLSVPKGLQALHLSQRLRGVLEHLSATVL